MLFHGVCARCCVCDNEQASDEKGKRKSEFLRRVEKVWSVERAYTFMKAA